MERLEQFLEWGGTKRSIVLLVISAAALVMSLVGDHRLPFDPAWIAVILCGVPILLEAVIGLVTEFDICADVLVSLALIAAVIIGETFAAGEVAVIMQLGSLLEELTVARARAGIERLVRLTPRTARVVTDGGETVLFAEQVKVGDLIRVLPGETVPVDGVIRTGVTSIDQAVVTGEPLPVDREPGDEVFSGTVNQFGPFDMEATRVDKDSAIQRMIRLVQSADAGKAKIVGLADKWARWIVVIALISAGLTWLVSHEAIRAVTVLVVFCPCALVLATPTAIMAAVGNATRHGVLTREGDALERLSKVRKITFDKTGTLTYGTPEVTAVRSFSGSLSETQLYRLAAAAEQWSEHPLGRAVVRCYRAGNGEAPACSRDFQMLTGRGVAAVVEGKQVLAGNGKLLSAYGIALPEEISREAEIYRARGGTVIFTAVDGTAAGFLVLSDTLRPSAERTVRQLGEIGIAPVLLTGDHDSAARYVAGQLAIPEVHADCLPEDKLTYIGGCQDAGESVCMIGDGINDAPALKKALVGIAMGGVGSDIAVEAADLVLAGDDICEIPHLLRLSRRMMTTIKCNLVFSLALNFIAIVLAIVGILNPVAGALVHNAGSVFVIVNSALLLGWRGKTG
ncbi:MAG: cation-translocating P-type ATPase [Oscillospiraceae bacterium]|nr:cation-translocating P-type ATPase [Oscillospiraceae bacterium]